MGSSRDAEDMNVWNLLLQVLWIENLSYWLCWRWYSLENWPERIFGKVSSTLHTFRIFLNDQVSHNVLLGSVCMPSSTGVEQIGSPSCSTTNITYEARSIVMERKESQGCLSTGVNNCQKITTTGWWQYSWYSISNLRSTILCTLQTHGAGDQALGVRVRRAPVKETSFVPFIISRARPQRSHPSFGRNVIRAAHLRQKGHPW